MPSNVSVCAEILQSLMRNMASLHLQVRGLNTLSHRCRRAERAVSRQSDANRDVSDICSGILFIYPVKETLCHREPFRSQPAALTALKRGLFFPGGLPFRPEIPTLTWKPRLLLQVEGTARGTQEKDWVDWIRVNLLFLTAVCWQGHSPTLWVTGYLECARRTAGGGSPIMTGGSGGRGVQKEAIVQINK